MRAADIDPAWWGWGILSWDGDQGPISDGDRAAYVEAWSQEHAMTAMINWYRAGFRTFPMTLDDARIRVETMLIWGERDPFLDRSLAEASIRYCDSGRVVYVPDATHWVHHERPEPVAGLILGFLRRASEASDRAAGT
jgi:epoxide hydrolase 4